MSFLSFNRADETEAEVVVVVLVPEVRKTPKR